MFLSKINYLSALLTMFQYDNLEENTSSNREENDENVQMDYTKKLPRFFDYYLSENTTSIFIFKMTFNILVF